MNNYSLAGAIFICLLPMCSTANSIQQECLGRLNFDTTEDIQWATFPVNTYSLNNGGGHVFSETVSARGDNTKYQYDDLLIKVSDTTTKDEFDRQRNHIIQKGEEYKKELESDLRLDEKMLGELEKDKETDSIERIKTRINTLKSDIPKAKVYEHDLGIEDAHILGSKNIPFQVLLWRKQRIYYFNMSIPTANSAQRIKDLIARFEPRELYQVPKGPGVCLPYGFIHDDGKTGFSVKNSLRFTNTPNVIMSMINASQDDPTKATSGTYNTDHNPGYDAEKWKKSKIMEKFYFGDRMTTLEGWRLDPRPESDEQERAWFAIAHVGGLASPLMAVQMFTFKQGTDGLKDLTPPPEAVIPRFLKLTQSIKPQ